MAMNPCRPPHRLLTLGFLLTFGVSVSFAAVPHVIHISVDGLGAVYLRNYVTNAPAEFPNFVRLKTQGAFTFNARCDYGASETIANHACMFTGRPSLRPAGFPDTTHHGLINNSPSPNETYHNSGNPNVPYKASVFDVVHDHGLTTAFYAGKSKLSICDRSFDDVSGGLDLFGDDNGRDKIDFSLVGDFAGYYNSAVTVELDVLINNLTNEPPKNYTFAHMAEPDLTGHYNGGWGSANYSNMVRFLDQQIGRVFTAVESNPLLAGRTVMIVTTDHGGLQGGHSAPQYEENYTIPFFVWGPNIPAGADLYALLSNRGDPGTNRTDYSTVPQPLRNGDVGNLVLTLLGLPLIPGSLMQPAFTPNGVSLTARKAGGDAVLSWPSSAVTYVLEHAASVEATEWEIISEGIAEEGGEKFFTVANPGNATGFYRLRKL